MTVTSFVGIFDTHRLGAPVARIEVPLFQRDYAQGRLDTDVTAIRERFVTALCEALREDAPPLALDFVYGEVQPSDKALVPLDGQQRLTTLFLLHWYIAGRAGVAMGEKAWTRFSYATRPSAEFFCRALVRQIDLIGPELPDDLSGWIIDQPWFLYTWNADPTVRGMLVTLDAIHAKVNDLDIDPQHAWTRLAGPNPAVWFHFRSIEDMGDESDLYIKMNSRGKPLTSFENLKARLETNITSTEQRRSFARKIDGDWSDLLWSMRRRVEPDPSGLPQVREHRDEHDRRFMRYLTFVTDICAWSSETEDEEPRDRANLALEDWVDSVFRANLDPSIKFLFDALDRWPAGDPSVAFAMFVPQPTAHSQTNDIDRLTLFFEGTHLLKECCDKYGTNQFTLPQTLMLYAVILDRCQPDGSRSRFLRNARTLRNLIQATNIERTDMPGLIAEVSQLIRTDELAVQTGFNRAQARQEAEKQRLLAERDDPELTTALFALEDHDLLRGSLAAFDLHADTTTFIRRAATFHQLFSGDVDWLGLSGAMLTYGDYGWQRSRIHRQYGSGNSPAPWRVLLTQNDMEDRLTETRRALMALLDAAAEQESPRQFARARCARWLDTAREGQRFDWRYYFVANDIMRNNTSGVFHLSDDGLIARRLRPGQTHQASKQHDPYLLAIRQGLGPDLERRVTDPAAVWWVGIWLNVRGIKGVGIQSRPTGFALRLRPDVQPHFLERWSRAVPLTPCEPNDTPENDGSYRSTHRVRITQGPAGTDRVDRISLGIDLMKVLIEAVDASAGPPSWGGSTAPPVDGEMQESNAPASEAP